MEKEERREESVGGDRVGGRVIGVKDRGKEGRKGGEISFMLEVWIWAVHWAEGGDIKADDDIPGIPARICGDRSYHRLPPRIHSQRTTTTPG